MTKQMKRINLRLTEADQQRIAMQAQRVGWSVNKYIVAAAVQSAEGSDAAAQAQALAQAQTVAIVNAITDQFQAAGEQHAAAIAGAVKQIADADGARDNKLRDDLNRMLAPTIAAVKALKKETNQ